MFDSKDLEALANELKLKGASLELILSPGDGDSPLLERLSAAAEEIRAACEGAVHVIDDDAVELAGRPGLTISCRGRKNFHYLAAPEGFEAPPFIKTIIALAKGEQAGDLSRTTGLAELKEGAELKVFIARTCPHCPEMVSRANRVALAGERVSVSVIDIEEFPELVESFKIKSVPFTVLDGAMSWTGTVDPVEIVDQILARGGEEQAQTAFRSMVESGRLEQAVETILGDGGAACLAAVWKKSATSLRVGLMLAAEEALDSDPAALDDAVGFLTELLDSSDAALRGDTADLLGKIGATCAVEKLEALRDDPNPDVAEIAAEALEEIEARGR